MRGVLPCWPANRSARPRSTSRFAGGRAFPGCGPSRVCIRSTSSQLPPGFQAGAFAGLTGAAAPLRRTVFQMRFAFLAEAPASTDGADVPRGSLLDRSPSKSLPDVARASWNPRVSATVGGSHHRPAFRGLASGSASRTAHLVAEAVKPRATRWQLSWVSVCPPGFDRATLPRISPRLPSRSCRTAQAVTGASRYLSVALR
jgi:hypothetical protein